MHQIYALLTHEPSGWVLVAFGAIGLWVTRRKLEK